MIVSEIEILKVLGLLARGAAKTALPAQANGNEVALGPDPNDDEDVSPGDARDHRLTDLRSRLDHGRYEVAPADVAEKMVGRAICDQVARLYDA
jgi:hypothetical protein